MTRRIIRQFYDFSTLLVLGLVAVTAVVLVAPTNFGLWAAYPLVQLEAIPLVWIVALLLSASLTVTLLCHTAHKKGKRRRALQILALVLVAAIFVEVTAFALAGGFMSARRATVESGSGNLTVLSFNARDTEAAEISRAAIEFEADALLLVEIRAEEATEVAQLLDEHGLDNQVFKGSGSAARGVDGTAVITSRSMGPYRRIPSASLVFGSVSAEPAGPQDSSMGTLSAAAPRLSAVHPPPPVPGKFYPAIWKKQLQAAVQACLQESGSIIGGDFNAVAVHIDRSTDEDCLDAAAHLDRDAVGTWPAMVPAPLGASIDHQLTDRRAWEPTGIRFLDLGRSDHRALVVTYRAVDS